MFRYGLEKYVTCSRGKGDFARWRGRLPAYAASSRHIIAYKSVAARQTVFRGSFSVIWTAPIHACNSSTGVCQAAHLGNRSAGFEAPAQSL